MGSPDGPAGEWGPIRGSAYEFYATDDEVQRLVAYGLGPAAHQWRLVGVDFGVGAYEIPADELLDHVTRPDGHRRTEFRLCPPSMAPGCATVLGRVPSPGSPWSSRDIEAFGSINGLVGIRLMQEITGPMAAGYSAATLLVTTTVGSHVDGTIREWPDSKRLFDRLKRRLRRDEVGRAIAITPGGAEIVTARGVSPGVAAAVADGFRLYRHRIDLGALTTASRPSRRTAEPVERRP